MPIFPPLHDNWEPTRATLHAYAHGVGAIPRALGVPHPKWWHVSLKVRPTGLSTDSIGLPDGGVLAVRMDLNAHEAVVETSRGERTTVDMAAGATGTQFADRVIAAVAGFGLDGDYDRERFEDDEPRAYTPGAAEAIFAALSSAAQVLRRHRAAVGGEVGPVQVWPHGFDVATEWFGAMVGEGRSQINLGLYPGGDRPYFYCNPWPFHGDVYGGEPLPHGAEWHTGEWEGSMLPYDLLAGDPDADTKLLEYARRVHDLASPTLLA